MSNEKDYQQLEIASLREIIKDYQIRMELIFSIAQKSTTGMHQQIKRTFKK